MKMKEVSLDRQWKRMNHTTSCHKNYKAEQDVPRMLPKEESNQKSYRALNVYNHNDVTHGRKTLIVYQWHGNQQHSNWTKDLLNVSKIMHGTRNLANYLGFVKSQILGEILQRY